MLLLNIFKLKRWSPWATGITAGVSSAMSIVLTEKTLGASGGFETLASIAANALSIVPEAAVFFMRIKPPVFDHQLILLMGIMVGAFTASILSGDFRFRMIPDNGWRSRFGKNKIKRLVMLFAGCFMMAVGAGIAGGCTSGLGISGTIQLSPAGFIFIAGVFVSGVVTFNIIFRKTS